MKPKLTERQLAARREYQRRWRERNADHVREYLRGWRAQNPEKLAEYEARRLDRLAEQYEEEANKQA